MLAGADPGAGHDDLLAACAAERDLPQALAAIDLALWDRAGRRAGRPVARLLAPGAAERVAVNATLSAADRAGAAAQAAAAAAAGFGCVKVKVGIGDDAGRVAAVRAAAGREVAIRVDANGAWSTAREALANLRALAGAGLEYAEEPVHGLDALAEVRAAGVVRVAMDETAAEPGAVASGATDAVCLKIARCGGITGLLRDARAARAAGSAVYVASSFDGPLGIAAGVHAAAALAAEGAAAVVRARDAGRVCRLFEGARRSGWLDRCAPGAGAARCVTAAPANVNCSIEGSAEGGALPLEARFASDRVTLRQ